VRRIGGRHGRYRFRQIVKDFREQRLVKVHVNGLPCVRLAHTMQAERDPVFIQMRVKRAVLSNVPM